MRLGYFTMPVHPIGRDWSQTLREDREAIILADKLGFYDAFVGEHLTDACENITNSMLFHATLIHDTKTDQARHRHHQSGADASGRDRGQRGDVRSSGARPLHHGRLARRAHLGCEAIGILDQDRNKIFAEAIDVILAVWERDPPYDIDFPDNRFKVGFANNRRARISASASWPSPSRSRGRRSSAPWWRRSRPAWC